MTDSTDFFDEFPEVQGLPEATAAELTEAPTQPEATAADLAQVETQRLTAAKVKRLAHARVTQALTDLLESDAIGLHVGLVPADVAAVVECIRTIRDQHAIKSY